MPAVRMIVQGKVQGVFFRAATKKHADQLGLKGYVKNLPDGSLEIVAQGGKEALQELKQWANLGTKQAKVEKLILKSINLKENYSEFSIEK